MTHLPPSKSEILKEILGQFPDLVFFLNKDGIIQDFFAPNPADLYLDPNQFLKRNFRESLPESIRREFEPAFLECATTGRAVSFEYPLQFPGADRFFEGRFFCAPADQSIILMVRDISNQQQTRTQLKSLSRLHQLIVEFSSLLVQARIDQMDARINYTLQLLGEYAEVDRVYIFDYEEETDIINNTFEWCAEGISPEIDNLQGVPMDFIPRWREKFNRKEHVYIPLVSEIDPQYQIEREILEPQGIQSLLTIPMFFGEKYMGFIGFDSVRHIREWSQEHIDLLRLAGEILAGNIGRVKFEREILEARRLAEQANKAKSEFLASMSHEIRTPMTHILGFSEILYNQTEDVRSKNFLSGILSSSRTLLYLINDILDLSKIEAGQLEIKPVPTRMADIFQEIGRIFRSKVQEKNLEYTASLSDDFPPIILADDVRLRQILFNLVGNAVKFTHSGFVRLKGSCLPSEEESGHYDLEISVEDSGIGIPESFKEKIFEAFVQIDSDNTRQYGGTGLGLAITRRLTNMMNGQIVLESEVNKGSCFTILFKGISPTHHNPDRRNIFEWPANELWFKPSTLMVVDDVDFNRDLVRSFLKDQPIQILEASSGREGIAIARSQRPDLILMDLRMPMMSGYQAVEKLRETEETKSIPCVAFTASSMKHDEETIGRLFDGFLLKPLTRNELMDCLTKFLPHSTTDFSIPEQGKSQPNTGKIIEQFLGSGLDAQSLKTDLLKYILPDIRKLLIYLDNDVLENLDFHIRELASHHPVQALFPVLDELKDAANQYDFEHFHQLIQQLDIVIHALINLPNH